MSQIGHSTHLYNKMEPKDDSTFGELIEQHRDLIWHVCSDYSLSAAWTVDDAVQEVIVILWRDWHSFKGSCPVSHWIYRVATNTMLQIKRKMGNRPQPKAPPADGPTDDDANYRYLLELIDTLDGVEARIVRAHLDGFSNKEIAWMVNLPVTAVAKRLSRTRSKLKHYYENGF